MPKTDPPLRLREVDNVTTTRRIPILTQAENYVHWEASKVIVELYEIVDVNRIVGAEFWRVRRFFLGITEIR
jgi:hypothetical protein